MIKTKWPSVPIEELCLRVTSGGTPSRANPGYYDRGTIPWIKTGELRGWYVDEIGERITPTAVQESSAKVFPPETVLLAMYGDGKTMGSVGLVRTPAATNQACCAMLANPARCDPKFLLYSLVYFRPALLKLAISGAQRNLNGKSIKQFAIGAPPVDVQARIASILSAYDDLIENNTRRIAILEEMARRIYEEWFVRFRFPGFEAVRMVESELGLVPEGWRAASLADVAAYINRGLAPKYDEAAACVVINQKCIRDQRLNLGEARRQSKPVPVDKLVRAGDVLINSTGVGTLGRVAQVLEDIQNCTVDTHVSIVRPGNDCDADFFGLTLLARQPHFEAQGVGSTGQTELSRGRIAETGLVVPPMATQRTFAGLVRPMRSLAITLQKKNQNLRTTRDLLLPKLISGELDVSALPALEPLAA